MGKIISLLIAMALGLSLTGCSNNESSKELNQVYLETIIDESIKE